MTKSWKEISVDEVLDFAGPQTAEIARYERIMQHHTIEAMNGLSFKLNGVMETIHRAAQLGQEKADEAIAQVRAAGEAQGKQQRTMNRLTFVIALATVAYTATTIYAVHATVSAQQAANSQQIESVRGSGAVPESAAVHMGTDEKGRAAVCVDGTAYDIPAPGDTRLKSRPQPARADGAIMPVLRCKD